jgi:hypothetical protein
MTTVHEFNNYITTGYENTAIGYRAMPVVKPNITFTTGGTVEEPILKISEEGFWVRGVKIEQDENEAAAVYKAFKRWMVEAELRRPWN